MTAGDDDTRHQDEDALLERARAGGEEAFAEIFLRYRNQVYSLAYRMTGSPTDAEDLCQEVFIVAMRKIGTFQGRSSFSTWLYRVTVNRSKDHLRKKKRSLELLRADEDAPGPEEMEDRSATARDGEPESRAMAGEAQRLVQDALMELPVSLRTPLVLHEIEGYQYEQIASMLLLPVGTIKSRIFRARMKLAEILEPHKELWG